MEFIADQTNMIVKQQMDMIKKKILEKVGDQITAENKKSIEVVFDESEYPFDGLTTSYERKKFIKNSFSYIVSILQACSYFFYILKKKQNSIIIIGLIIL